MISLYLSVSKTSVTLTTRTHIRNIQHSTAQRTVRDIPRCHRSHSLWAQCALLIQIKYMSHFGRTTFSYFYSFSIFLSRAINSFGVSEFGILPAAVVVGVFGLPPSPSTNHHHPGLWLSPRSSSLLLVIFAQYNRLEAIRLVDTHARTHSDGTYWSNGFHSKTR